MTGLPIPQAIEHRGVLRTLSGNQLRVDDSACPEILAAAADLTLLAHHLEIVRDRENPDVVLAVGPVVAPRPVGADPRPAGRAGVSEAYSIRPVGDVLRLTAEGAEGLFRGLTALARACNEELPALIVDDHPTYAWRGLSLDVSRRAFAFDEVTRVIDLLALHRMNVLHLHLTDTQAWRFAVPGYEGVAAPEHFSGEQLSALEQYARERFVVIVPEIDVPGHVAETVAESGVPVTTGAHPALAYIDTDAVEAHEFLVTAFATVAERFASPYLHLGGDEAFGAPAAVYNRSVAAVASIVRGMNRIPIGWQESVRSEAFGPDDIVQLWISERDAFDEELVKSMAPEHLWPLVDQAAALFEEAGGDEQRIADAGAAIIVSSSDPFYMDRKPSEQSTRAEQNKAWERLGNPGYEPTPSLSVLDWRPGSHRIGGIEAALWCETVNDIDDVAQLLLPRLALVAQRAWGEASSGEIAAAVHKDVDAWVRLGFANYYRSVDIFDAPDR